MAAGEEAKQKQDDSTSEDKKKEVSCVLKFRPREFWRGEYGFDWVREESDVYDESTYNPIEKEQLREIDQLYDTLSRLENEDVFNGDDIYVDFVTDDAYRNTLISSQSDPLAIGKKRLIELELEKRRTDKSYLIQQLNSAVEYQKKLITISNGTKYRLLPDKENIVDYAYHPRSYDGTRPMSNDGTRLVMSVKYKILGEKLLQLSDIDYFDLANGNDVAIDTEKRKKNKDFLSLLNAFLVIRKNNNYRSKDYDRISCYINEEEKRLYIPSYYGIDPFNPKSKKVIGFTKNLNGEKCIYQFTFINEPNMCVVQIKSKYSAVIKKNNNVWSPDSENEKFSADSAHLSFRDFVSADMLGMLDIFKDEDLFKISQEISKKGYEDAFIGINNPWELLKIDMGEYEEEPNDFQELSKTLKEEDEKLKMQKDKVTDEMKKKEDDLKKKEDDLKKKEEITEEEKKAMEKEKEALKGEIEKKMKELEQKKKELDAKFEKKKQEMKERWVSEYKKIGFPNYRFINIGGKKIQIKTWLEEYMENFPQWNITSSSKKEIYNYLAPIMTTELSLIEEGRYKFYFNSLTKPPTMERIKQGDVFEIQYFFDKNYDIPDQLMLETVCPMLSFKERIGGTEFKRLLKIEKPKQNGVICVKIQKCRQDCEFCNDYYHKRFSLGIPENGAYWDLYTPKMYASFRSDDEKTDVKHFCGKLDFQIGDGLKQPLLFVKVKVKDKRGIVREHSPESIEAMKVQKEFLRNMASQAGISVAFSDDLEVCLDSDFSKSCVTREGLLETDKTTLLWEKLLAAFFQQNGSRSTVLRYSPKSPIIFVFDMVFTKGYGFQKNVDGYQEPINAIALSSNFLSKSSCAHACAHEMMHALKNIHSFQKKASFEGFGYDNDFCFRIEKTNNVMDYVDIAYSTHFYQWERMRNTVEENARAKKYYEFSKQLQAQKAQFRKLLNLE